MQRRVIEIEPPLSMCLRRVIVTKPLKRLTIVAATSRLKEGFFVQTMRVPPTADAAFPFPPLSPRIQLSSSPKLTPPLNLETFRDPFRRCQVVRERNIGE